MSAIPHLSVYVYINYYLTYDGRLGCMQPCFLYSILMCLEQIEQKQKYAIWKAAEIRKALKEGRKPEAGPPGGDKDEAPVSTVTISQVIILVD
jgi:hypothetical protein